MQLTQFTAQCLAHLLSARAATETVRAGMAMAQGRSERVARLVDGHSDAKSGGGHGGLPEGKVVAVVTRWRKTWGPPVSPSGRASLATKRPGRLRRAGPCAGEPGQCLGGGCSARHGARWRSGLGRPAAATVRQAPCRNHTRCGARGLGMAGLDGGRLQRAAVGWVNREISRGRRKAVRLRK